MNENSQNDQTEFERGIADAVRLDRLRIAGIGAAAVGGVLSLGLTLYAGRDNTSPLLPLLFAGWVTLPFVGLVLANMRSECWHTSLRKTLFAVTILIVLISPAAYTGIISPPKDSPRAFAFVVVPLLSWCLAVLTLASAAVFARRYRR